MEIYHQLLNTLPKEPFPIKKVIVGVHWTLVCSKYCGLASTLVNCGPHGHSSVRDVGVLQTKSANELSEWILSENYLEASIGMAAINSLIDVDESKLVKMNASEIIAKKGKGKNVVIIGHFPFVKTIRGIPKNCWVIEKNPYGDEFPEDAAQIYLPKADLIAITGTAFINHTIEKLLSFSKPSALIMILGPSTPLTPLLFDYRCTYLSGARVDDSIAAINTISQGAILPQVSGIRLVSMKRV